MRGLQEAAEVQKGEIRMKPELFWLCVELYFGFLTLLGMYVGSSWMTLYFLSFTVVSCVALLKGWKPKKELKKEMMK